MADAIDLGTYGPQLKKTYDAIVSSDPEISWAVFNYEANSSKALKPSAQGASSLDDFVDEFDDGKIQYGFCRVDYDNRPKFVLVGWVGEGVPDRNKGYFSSQYATVAKYFPNYHIQITARSTDDLSSEIIFNKVVDASGSKYGAVKAAPTVPRKPNYVVASQGADEDDWGDAPPVKEVDSLNKVESAYRPTKVDLAAIRKSASTKSAPAKPSSSESTFSSGPSTISEPSTTYKPIGKVDIAALRAQAKDSKFADDGPQPLQSAYKPIGKVDIAAIRAAASSNPKVERQSQPEPEPESKPEPETEHILPVKERLKSLKSGGSSEPGDINDDEPKPVAERLKAFSSGGRLTEMPKHKVGNSVASRYNPADSGATSRGTKPPAPTYKNVFPPFDGARKPSNPGFLDHASENGKSPAQIWAEKHGKANFDKPAAEEPAVRAASPEEEVREENEVPAHASIASLKDRFAAASLEDEEASNEPEPAAAVRSTSSFADITSKFAKAEKQPSPDPVPIPRAIPRPSEPEPEPEQEPVAPSLPKREPTPEAAPSLPSRAEEPAPAPAPAQASSSEGLAAVVVYSYEKDEDNEISLEISETITSIEKVDDDWWLGTNSKGETGLFPSAYVEEVSGSEEQAPAAASAAPVQAEHTSEAEPATTSQQAVAEYDYEAAEEGELTFAEGDLITDVVFEDEDWWSGLVNGSGPRGLFPANYVSLK